MNRKKRHPLSALLCFLVFLSVLLSCNAEVPGQSAASQDTASTSASQDILVGYYICGDYKLDEAQTQSALTDVLVILDKESSAGKSGTGFSKSAAPVSSSYVFTKTSSFSYSMAGADISKGAEDDYCVVFNDYRIVSDGNRIRHALVSDDMRIGPVLCVVDGEPDSSMYFTEAYLEAVKQYADSIGISWSGITPEDVEDFREKYVPGGEGAKLAACLQIRGLEEIPENSYTDTVLPSAWHQSSPFNAAVMAVTGKDRPVGCANLAVAMICCYYGYPSAITASTRNVLSNPLTAPMWSAWAASGGEIDWASVREVDQKKNWESSDSGDQVLLSAGRSLSAFLLDSYRNTHSVSISEDSTGTQVADVLKWLKDMGYRMDQESPGDNTFGWSYENLISSLSNGHPVLGHDSNHMFIADGLSSMHTGVYPVLGWIISEEPATYLENYRFVHMNYGWGGSGDGWYNEIIVNRALEIIANKEDPDVYGTPKVPTDLILNLCPDK